MGRVGVVGGRYGNKRPMPPEPDIARLIESAGRADAGVLHAHCWPRGGDRTDAVAREWVRLWGPQRAITLDWDVAPPN